MGQNTGASGSLDETSQNPSRKYADDQPRVPAGNSEGGRWTSGGGASAPDGTLIDLAVSAFIDLLTEEGGTHGGHTIRDHVGKSEASLLHSLSERIQEIKDRGHGADGLHLGSFSSLTAANKLVNSTVSGKKSDIDSFLGSFFPFLKITSHYASPTGIEDFSDNIRSQPYIRTTDGVSVILVRNPLSKNGFSILTAFPMK